MTKQTVDAIVIGAGPNGLVAAIALADAGWDVVLLEANESVGGAVSSAEVTSPGYRTDMFSAFYPLAAASPVIKSLDLTDHGLSWVQAEKVLAHALPNGRSAVLERDPTRTAAGLEEFGAGDGQAWLEMFAGWQQIRDPLLDAMFTPIPPIRSVLTMLGRTKLSGLLDLARLAVLPVRRLGQENFSGDGGPLLLTGNAMHADVPPDAAGSGIFGWLLAMLGQDVGFPVPQGGAQNLAFALQRRFESAGGHVVTNARVTSVLVSAGRATGVRTADGSVFTATKAVLADVAAPTLYRELVGLQHLPAKVGESLDRFQWDNPTLKINWALDRPLAWRSAGAVGAGTVHFGTDLDGFVDFAADLSVGRQPRHPFVLFGQMTTADPTRSPQGTESTWAYTHVPKQMSEDKQRLDDHVRRVEEHLEQLAPGFESRITSTLVQYPNDLERLNANLVNGAINGGTSYPHQQLIFRPTPGLGRPETPIQGLFLASASAHPGGGVHGACGWNAATSALHSQGPLRAVRRQLAATAWARLLRS